MSIIAIDTETFLISAEDPAPKIVCVSFANEKGQTSLRASCDPYIVKILRSLLTGDDLLVFHSAAFDLSAMVRTWPELEPLIWAKLEKQEITDTIIREKLLNLSTIGAIDSIEMPNGAVERIHYHLSDLEKKYLGIDRTDQKEGPDVWRLRYSELDGMASKDYPEVAYKYAIEDATGTMKVYRAQEVRKLEEQCAQTTTEGFQTATDFALKLITLRGFRIDRERRDKLAAELAEELAPENMLPLVDAGILRAGTPELPYKNGAKHPDGTPKMKAAKPPSINKKVLQAVIEDLCKAQGLEVAKTEKGQTSASAGTIQELVQHSFLLKVYQHRQELQRLAGTELPRLDADFVHPNFSVLKETGRTSSFGNARGGMEPYPSTNCQQIDPRARGVFIPRKGYVFASVDYSGLELCSLAQRTQDLFGRSMHFDKIEKGYDLHAFLGAQIAYSMDSVFQEYCNSFGATSSDRIYNAFLGLKEGDDIERTFFKHYRKLAKPTGLGYPGGLGSSTFITFAKAVYGVEVTQEEADKLKELWFATYPEMRQYFNYISERCEDPMRPETYRYTTPGGMLRRGCSYCAACNGNFLQSPSAEGFKLAIFNVVRACREGELKDSYVVAEIHDELIVEIPEALADKHAKIVSRIMVESMNEVLPDVKIEAEPALMRRWDKRAEPVFGKGGELIPWEES